MRTLVLALTFLGAVVLVANTQPEAHNDGPAYWIKVVAQPNGSFMATNSRNGFSRAYSR